MESPTNFSMDQIKILIGHQELEKYKMHLENQAMKYTIESLRGALADMKKEIKELRDSHG